MHHLLLFFFLGLVVSCGTSSDETNTNANKGLKLDKHSYVFELEQRHSTVIPGYNQDLKIEIGDITGGTVNVILSTDQGVISEKYFSENEDQEFAFDDIVYKLVCTRQENNLIGTDFATFEISESNFKKVESNSEKSNIDKEINELIGKIEISKVIFIRNGSEYSGKEAADHLRKKWENSGVEFENMGDFIDKIASKSSQTGEPYQIKLESGEILDAKIWMEGLLLNEKN